MKALTGFTVAVTVERRRDELAALLESYGARVVRAPAIRITPAPPADPAPLQRLVDLIISRLVDAVTFTSDTAVVAVLNAAGGERDAVLAALRGDVLAGCLGPLAATTLLDHEVPVLAPARGGRGDLGALARALVEELPRRTHTLRVAGSELVLRGHVAVLDGVLKPLPPGQMAILRALASAPGRVLPRSELLSALPRGADEHAVEMTVARLRAALGDRTFIQTVVRRGYRLLAESGE